MLNKKHILSIINVSIIYFLRLEFLSTYFKTIRKPLKYTKASFQEICTPKYKHIYGLWKQFTYLLSQKWNKQH